MWNSTIFAIASLARREMGEKRKGTGILVLTRHPSLFLNNCIIHRKLATSYESLSY